MPSKLNSSANSNFQPGPTADPTTLDVTNTSSSGTNYDITLATKIDNSLPSGKYSNTFVLTATSNEPPYDDIMQNWNGCDSLSSEEEVNLLDTRDNKVYIVAKLKDGKCWMTQNLALGKEDSTTKLTSADSDVSSNFTLPASSTSGFNTYGTSSVYVDSTYGGYYTWYAATAGEGTPGKSNSETSHSICPKDWRLPTKAEFDSLISAQGAAKMTQSPANFQLGSSHYNGLAGDQGSEGVYWSSTAGNAAADAYYLGVRSSDAYTSYSNKYYGFSVRCVSRSTDPIGTMQTVDDWGDSVQENQVVHATDTRDNKDYTVARLADGKLWMTENLKLGKSTTMTLTSSDSDISSNFTLPASSKSGFSSYDVSNVYVDSTYGGYYSWYAATAGEGTQSKSSGDTSHSICPKGWRLPTKAEFDSLISAQGATKMTQSPANFQLGGTYYSGSAVDQGSYGYYWSSSAYNTYGAYRLYVNSSSAVTNNRNKSDGFSVRCVARTDLSEATNLVMQNVSEWGGDVASGQTVKAKDSRDNTEYTVTRLADGKLWMTKNLKIQNYNLTSNDSDVSSSFSIPASTANPNSSNTYSSKELHIDSTYGGYYTWYTATAGEGTTSVSTDGINVEHSICPKGWRLPTKDEFVALDKAFGGTGENSQSSFTVVGGYKTLLQMYQEVPANFLMGGYYTSGTAYNVGSYASYWSSTANDANYAYNLDFDSSCVNPQGLDNKSSLRSVRCVSRQ